MENLFNYSQNNSQSKRIVDIHTFIQAENIIFQLFFAEKRYKLIKFAPKLEIVDKLPDTLIISE